jgi:hypothetical protein
MLQIYPRHTLLQGVDVDLFKPHEGKEPYEFTGAHNLYGKGLKPATAADLEGKWVLFSGGKLEVRKGQDLVVAGSHNAQRRLQSIRTV